MEHQELLRHRILFLGDPIDHQMANRLIARLFLLDAEDPRAPIDLYINSPGGSLLDGLAIIDTMLCLRAPVHTVCIGKAYSMAAWILAAGARGHRLATPNAEIMIHQLSTGIEGEAGDIEVYARRILRLQQRMVDLLCRWTGKSPEQIRSDIQRDFFLTAPDARDYGVIDGILEPESHA